jgi:hypothetical protein
MGLRLRPVSALLNGLHATARSATSSSFRSSERFEAVRLCPFACCRTDNEMPAWKCDGVRCGRPFVRAPDLGWDGQSLEQKSIAEEMAGRRSSKATLPSGEDLRFIRRLVTLNAGHGAELGRERQRWDISARRAFRDECGAAGRKDAFD